MYSTRARLWPDSVSESNGVASRSGCEVLKTQKNRWTKSIAQRFFHARCLRLPNRLDQVGEPVVRGNVATAIASSALFCNAGPGIW